jgi:hypothetical protein
MFAMTHRKCSFRNCTYNLFLSINLHINYELKVISTKIPYVLRGIKLCQMKPGKPSVQAGKLQISVHLKCLNKFGTKLKF